MEAESCFFLSSISTVGQNLGLNQIHSMLLYTDLPYSNPEEINLQHTMELLPIWKLKSTGEIRSLKKSN